MHFIRDTWYAASWTTELADKPIGRRILDEEIVLYRTASGEAVALGGVCPHRFASLAEGKLHGDSIACPYHGLRFGSDGRCTHNPHGPVSGAVRVRQYPLVERQRMLWIWMGSGSPEMATLPDTQLLEKPGLTWVNGSLHVLGNYQLVIDNLLDLSHVEFMHPFLGGGRETDDEPLEYRAEQEGDRVRALYDCRKVTTTPLVYALWPDAPDKTRLWAYMHWSPAANLYLDSGFASVGTTGSANAVLLPTYHLLTPETATTTHYFWWAGRNTQLEDENLSEQLREGFTQAFKLEDEPMIADIQRRLGNKNLMDMQPLLLSIDNAAVRARRIVEKKLKEQKLSDHEVSVDQVDMPTGVVLERRV